MKCWFFRKWLNWVTRSKDDFSTVRRVWTLKFPDILLLSETFLTRRSKWVEDCISLIYISLNPSFLENPRDSRSVQRNLNHQWRHKSNEFRILLQEVDRLRHASFFSESKFQRELPSNVADELYEGNNGKCRERSSCCAKNRTVCGVVTTILKITLNIYLKQNDPTNCKQNEKNDGAIYSW